MEQFKSAGVNGRLHHLQTWKKLLPSHYKVHVHVTYLTGITIIPDKSFRQVLLHFDENGIFVLFRNNDWPTIVNEVSELRLVVEMFHHLLSLFSVFTDVQM